MHIRILDLFCGAGFAARGYHDGFTKAGFTVSVTGVDLMPIPHYPYTFVQEDALAYASAFGWAFDFIHASPPCEGSSSLTPKRYRINHEQLIPQTRYWLHGLGKPYVIENVKGARKQLHNPIMLCGTMFGLPIFRHRYFETNAIPELRLLPPCDHSITPIPINSSSVQRTANKAEIRRGLDIEYLPWDCATRDQLRKAIPPIYTSWLAQQIAPTIRNTRTEMEPEAVWDWRALVVA